MGSKIKLRISGSALVITILVLAATYEKIERAAKDALELVDDKKNVLFSIRTNGSGAISDHSMIFDSTDPSGNLRCTILLDNMPATGRKQFVEEKYLLPLSRLAQVIEQIETAAATVDAQTAELFSAMEVD